MTTRIEQLLQQLGSIAFPGIFDTLSAKIAERVGFPMGFVSGYSVAATAIGEPDMGLLTQTELIDRARAAGVFAYLVKPFKPSDLAPSIEVARARFEQNVLLNKEVTNLSQRLEARKAIDRAKGILMDSHSLGEAEAYRRIQVQSMNLRKTMQEVAEAIILAKSI
jgi:CheY-like chemotaxis protein